MSRKCEIEWGVVGYDCDQVRVSDVGVRGHGKRAEPIVTMSQLFMQQTEVITTNVKLFSQLRH